MKGVGKNRRGEEWVGGGGRIRQWERQYKARFAHEENCEFAEQGHLLGLSIRSLRDTVHLDCL